MKNLSRDTVLLVVIAMAVTFTMSSWLQKCNSDEMGVELAMLQRSIEIRDSVHAENRRQDSILVDSIKNIRAAAVYYREKQRHPKVDSVRSGAKKILIDMFIPQ